MCRPSGICQTFYLQLFDIWETFIHYIQSLSLFWISFWSLY
jgi:hypothetical protein